MRLQKLQISLICCLRLILFLAGREKKTILIFLISSLSCPMEERSYCSGCHRSDNCHLGSWGQILFLEESQGWAQFFIAFWQVALARKLPWMWGASCSLRGGCALPQQELRRCNWPQLFFSLGCHLDNQRSWLRWVWSFYCPWISLGIKESGWFPSWATQKKWILGKVPSMHGQKKLSLLVWPHLVLQMAEWGDSVLETPPHTPPPN